MATLAETLAQQASSGQQSVFGASSFEADQWEQVAMALEALKPQGFQRVSHTVPWMIPIYKHRRIGVGATQSFVIELDTRGETGIMNIHACWLQVKRHELVSNITAASDGSVGAAINTGTSIDPTTEGAMPNVTSETVVITNPSTDTTTNIQSPTNTGPSPADTTQVSAGHIHRWAQFNSATPGGYSSDEFIVRRQFGSTEALDLALSIGSNDLYTESELVLHTHGLNTHTHTNNHTHGMQGHSHSNNAHLHTMNHKHKMGDHAHGITITYGFYKNTGVYPSVINIIINGTNRTAALTGPWSNDFRIDIWQYLVANTSTKEPTRQVHTIEFTSSTLGELEVTGYMRCNGRFYNAGS